MLKYAKQPEKRAYLAGLFVKPILKAKGWMDIYNSARLTNSSTSKRQLIQRLQLRRYFDATATAT